MTRSHASSEAKVERGQKKQGQVRRIRKKQKTRSFWQFEIARAGKRRKKREGGEGKKASGLGG